MGLTNEHVGPEILAKIKIYVLTRAELRFQVCYEIPCSICHQLLTFIQIGSGHTVMKKKKKLSIPAVDNF